MRIGYPCQNSTVGCTSASTFRLRSYSEERLVRTVAANLACLRRILLFNDLHSLRFFRITSDLVPFASHPVNRFDWPEYFAGEFSEIGRLARERGIRLALHPDQFILLNAHRQHILENSLRELQYHARLLDLMGADTTAKIQIHVGGAYENKEKSLARFIARYHRLPEEIRRRLVIENDDRNYSLQDCLHIHRETGIPVVLDNLHHKLNHHGESLAEAFALVAATWSPADGPPMADYSEQDPGRSRGAHALSVTGKEFQNFLAASRPFDFDLMMELKDKEKSALQALKMAAGDPRLRH